MSEISKARERMFNKRGVQQQTEVRDSSNPRKFTVSSLTHNLEYRPSEPNIAPSIVFSSNRPFEIPGETKTQRNFNSRAKENNPILKTINIKFAQNSQLGFSRIGSEVPEMESAFHQSPPRVNYKRPYHRQKLQLILAPPTERRHQSPYKPRECLRQWADGTISQVRSQGRGFVDSFFPPSKTIICTKKVLHKEVGLKFQKLSRIYNCDMFLVNSCEPTLIKKGAYSNTYLYSALTILAEDPSRILSLFGKQEINEDGAYHICLCKDGVWRYIIVDQFMPIKSIGGRKEMLFMHSRQEEKGVQIWSALVEKAIAKIYGTYIDLAVSVNEGMIYLFRMLTGAPVSTYLINKDFRSFLLLIDAALKRGHIVTLDGISEQCQQTARIRKLERFFAYRVLQIKKTGLKIRNYQQPQLITRLAFDECLIFTKIIIYRTESNFRYITHKLRHKKGFYSKLTLTVPSATKCYLDIWQNNPGYYIKHIDSDSKSQYKISSSKLWLSRRGDDDGQWIQNGKLIQLQQDIYYVNVHLCQDKELDFTVSYYGERDITMERVKCSERWTEQCQCSDE